MLEVRDLYYAHHSLGKEVLQGVSFAVSKGLVTAILGPNGSGKTTLLKCLTGLWSASRGQIMVNGNDVSALSVTERARIFAAVPQDHVPPFPYTVLEVVLMGRAPYISPFALPSPQDYGIAERTLQTLGIVPLKDRPYTAVSGGERQLVLIARALAQEAPCLLLDEPTAHLDFRHQVLVLNTLRKLVIERQLIALMTLHDPNLALQFSDYVVLMDDGKVVNQGPPDEIITEKNIKEIYKVSCSIFAVNGQRFLCPKIER
ncbi:MAG: ABC transporter ATP-binding protein [Syntrophales bacterium]|nr:ABC transporter ATP-binding protein [Syntrophales bacterium]